MAFYTIIIPIIEISIMAILINYLLSFFRSARFMGLLLFVLGFLLLLGISYAIPLLVLQKLLIKSSPIAIVGLLIIFQQDLRIALSNFSLKKRELKEFDEFDRFLDQLRSCIYRLAKKKIGALVILENRDGMEQFARKGMLLNAHFSSELLESLFIPNSPLHDGAVIIRQRTILAAAVILPLGEDTLQITNKSMGTRHRAALGMSQLTDALFILVSEESGKISIARDGALSVITTEDRFEGVIRSVFKAPITKPWGLSFKMKRWLSW